MKVAKLKAVARQYEHGFTLIELIVVIILISIMAVTVLPKFFSSNGFEEFTYRDELITKLRAIQLRAMQQTTEETCKIIQVETGLVTLIGLQKTDPDLNTDACTTGYAGDTTTVSVDPKHSVSFTLSESLTSFHFSSWGRPVGCITADPCEITITITGENSLEIFINSEGYIHEI